MKPKFPFLSGSILWLIGIIVILLVAIAFWPRWFPTASHWMDATVAHFRATDPTGETDDTDHDQHDHDSHAGHSEEDSLELSPQAQANIGLSPEFIQPIQLETFQRSITVPALVVEQPGRSRVQVATPMTGMVTHVHAVQGEAVEPGTLLLEIRLTHEDLVNAQTLFLKTLGELEVEEREIERLQEVTSSGAVAGKILLERQYARDKLIAALRAQKEALRLHGLDEPQIQQITDSRELLRELRIYAPTADTHQNDKIQLSQTPVRRAAFQEQEVPDPARNTPMVLQTLNVHKGQSVNAGETLCILTDYDRLFIEGMAFEQDIKQLREASENEWPIEAILQTPGQQASTISDLRIAYLSNEVDPESRTLHFYVGLPNRIAKDRREAGNRYIEWQYLPGQRMQLRVPVEQWDNQIVLPVDAVAREGAEYFVFQQNGKHFDRVPVHVRYRDQFYAVIQNDGSLFPGDVVALRGAHQMQMALKNKSGGAVDPHAGHNH